MVFGPGWKLGIRLVKEMTAKQLSQEHVSYTIHMSCKTDYLFASATGAVFGAPCEGDGSRTPAPG